MLTKKLYMFALVLCLSLGMSAPVWAEESITIGINMPLTGKRETTGLNAVAGARILQNEVNKNGGIEVGGKKYKVVLEVVDNKSNPQGAVSATLQLISQKKVLAIVGPNASSFAIPSGNIAQSFKTPMISPNSTNPKTTLDRPFIFRACFLDDFQGKVMADFATSEFNATKAAVLFNNANAYSRGLAGYFKAAFEATHGKGAIVAYEDFLTNEKDLTGQIKAIAKSDAEILFLPQYGYEVKGIVEQIRAAKWDKMILGGAAWASNDTAACGKLCEGLFFSSHFAAVGVEGVAKTFVEKYEAENNELPTGYAALAYDSLNLVLTAIKGIDRLSDNLVKNRMKIRDNLSKIKGFNGVTGVLDMDESGNPVKSAIVTKIEENGVFTSYETVSP